jgi:Flp pilus assembly pilin Flp
MLRNLNAVVAKLHRDERGIGSVEAIIMVGLGVLVLFTVGKLVGVGDTNIKNENSLIGNLFNLSVGKIFGFGAEK